MKKMKNRILVQVSEPKKDKTLTIADLREFFTTNEFSKNEKILETDSILRLEWHSRETSWSDKNENMFHTPFLILER